MEDLSNWTHEKNNTKKHNTNSNSNSNKYDNNDNMMKNEQYQEC